MKYLRYIITTTLVIAIFGGYFYYLTISGQIEKNPVSSTIIAATRPYPELTEPRELTLDCDYHGKNISVSETLYGSLYEYYRTDPAKKSAYLHNLEKDFVFYYEKDNTTRELAAKIATAGATNGLEGDQIVDLTACFVQNIPYDEVKAAKILGPNFTQEPISQVIPRYPYETLYDKTGICTDKTYLGAAILRELGYGTSILTFDKEKHMSLGVPVPAGYGSLGTEYGILELTGSGFLVGDMPELNPSAGTAVNNYDTLPLGDVEATTPKQLKLTEPTGVVVASSGRVYTRIVERAALKSQIDMLKPQLEVSQVTYQQAGVRLSAAEATLAAAEAAYKLAPTNATYGSYTEAYNAYARSYNDAQTKINQYNTMVNLYNSYIEKYKKF